MPERRLPGQLKFLGLGLVIALMLVPSVGVAAASTPVAVGASTVFAGNGFTPNEALSFWEAPANDLLTITPLGGAQTDASGGFTFTVSFPSAGRWQVTAHSITSGKEVTGSYAVGTTSTATSPIAAPASPTASSTTSGALPAGTLPAGIGAAVSFSGSGFTANEQVSLWETAPDSTVTGLTGTQTDGNGAFTVSITFPTAGNWQVTAHGITSVKETIGRYAVGTTGDTTSSPATAAAGGQGFSSVPPVVLGSAVSFSGSGFNGGEIILLWDTAPDATVAALDSISADGTGTFATTVTFPSAGNWQITAHGHDSAHEMIGRYIVTTDASTTAATTSSTTTSSTIVSPGITVATAGATVKTTTGTLISFIPTGFTVNELISVWSTGPDGTVTTLDPTQASSVGRVTITTSFTTEGLWQLTAHGRDSGREVIGRYQVTTRTTP